MRSVYVKITLWSFGTLLLSLVAFVFVSAVVSFQVAHRTGFFGRVQSLELELASEAYQSGGPRQLKIYVDRLQRYVPGRHFLTDAGGKDLLTVEAARRCWRTPCRRASRRSTSGGPSW